MWKRMILMIIFLGAVFGGVFGFQAFKNKMMAEHFATFTPPPQTVSAAYSEAQDWPPQLSAIGSVEAIRGVTVSAETAGVVREIKFSAGQQVKADDILVQLDDSEEQARLRGLEAQLALAKANYKREQELVKQHLVSKGNFEIVQAELRNSEAQVENMRAVIAKKTLRAPFAGVLGLRRIDLGQYVAPGTPLVELQTLDPIWVEFTLPEQAFHLVQTGQTVNVIADAFPEQRFSGEVSAVDNKINAANRNFTVQASLKNPQHSLHPGMFAKVEVILPGSEAYIVLPVTAIEYRLYGDSVFLLEKTAETNAQNQAIFTVTRQSVETGEQRGNRVSIIKGVKTGDYVVTSGQLKLQNGSQVVIDETVVF